MPLQSSSTTSRAAFSDGISSHVSIAVNQVDYTDSQIGEVDATASSRNNDVHASRSSDEQWYLVQHLLVE